MGEQVFQKLNDLRRLSASPLLVFAADPDCGGGLRCFGTGADGTPRNRADFLKLCREIARDGAVDGVLLSPLSAEILTCDESLFDDLRAQPLVRFNAESAVWGPRGGKYRQTWSQPFTTVPLDHESFAAKIKLGLYSITLNNDAESDWLALAAYLDFAQAVGNSVHWSHFLEVFSPQTEAQTDEMSLEATGEFIADSIVRLLSHLQRRERPLFLKTTFTTPQIWRELCDFDPEIVVGALGGARKSTLETLQLAQNVVENGGRAILFGRNIFEDPKPRQLCRLLREVLDRKLDADAAFELYQREN
jgi:hypothetical protein